MISICSQQCNYSMKRQRFYCLMNFAQSADIHMSGKRRNCTSSYSGSILSSTCRSKDQSNCYRKLGTLLDPATTRSDKHACGKQMLTDHDKQATENREPADETNKEDPTQGILVWLHPFTVNLEELEARVLAHSSERENSDSEGDASKVETWKQKHSVHAHFRKKPKRDLFCERKRMVTW